ncbi:RidA family protein [Aliiglaciecola sp. CAU 1673]|uniref:RidA family protein n=1 Tax=Aliiglaciecola sp. CAU 1673 TaxID=3032595 RepID=UPI0023D9DBAD|nr:RidA family protein [Aliiglaciecola sp. CAU 1673]MDF2180411.1 RidA family protein [Aliiglaciecola sp. CAU 1673]
MKLSKLLILASFLSNPVVIASAKELVIERDVPTAIHQETGFSESVKLGNTLYISGIVSNAPTYDEQVKDIYGKIGKILKKHDLTFDNVFRETIYTSSMDELRQALNTRKSFYSPGVYPAASWVEVSRLYYASFKLEVEVTAYIPDSGEN